MFNQKFVSYPFKYGISPQEDFLETRV